MNALIPPPRSWRVRISGEPALSELLLDPIVRLLMQSDHVGQDTLRDLIARVRANLANRVCCRQALAA